MPCRVAKIQKVARIAKVNQVSEMAVKPRSFLLEMGLNPKMTPTFNQDSSSLSVPSKDGFKLFNCGDPFGNFYSSNLLSEIGGVSQCEMLFNTSLVALVGGGNTATMSLMVYNTKRNSFICQLDYNSLILSFKLNKKRLVVALEESVSIYDMANCELLKTLSTNPNPNAIIALSPASNSLLAYLQSNSGSISIYDSDLLAPVSTINAHRNNITAMNFNFDGTMLATASDKGTVVRVFNVPSGELLFQFRRGTYSARIYSLSFSLTNEFLAVSSDSDTVHIFKLQLEVKSATVRKRSSVYSQVMSPVSFAGSLLIPETVSGAVSGIWDPQRDFAFAKIPKGSKVFPKSTCAITEQNLVVVANVDGMFYQYYLDVEKGGECSLRMQYSL